MLPAATIRFTHVVPLRRQNYKTWLIHDPYRIVLQVTARSISPVLWEILSEKLLTAIASAGGGNSRADDGPGRESLLSASLGSPSETPRYQDLISTAWMLSGLTESTYYPP